MRSLGHALVLAACFVACGARTELRGSQQSATSSACSPGDPPVVLARIDDGAIIDSNASYAIATDGTFVYFTDALGLFSIPVQGGTPTAIGPALAYPSFVGPELAGPVLADGGIYLNANDDGLEWLSTDGKQTRSISPLAVNILAPPNGYALAADQDGQNAALTTVALADGSTQPLALPPIESAITIGLSSKYVHVLDLKSDSDLQLVDHRIARADGSVHDVALLG